MSNITVSKNGCVYRGERVLGWVYAVSWPEQRAGRVTLTERWEARRPHEVLVVSPYAFPTFDTKELAAESLG